MLNILLLHFTESVYSVSETWILNEINKSGYLPDLVSKSNISLLDITIISVHSLFGMLLLSTAFTVIYCYVKNYTVYLTVKSILK